jgi:hypothetical protein
VVSERNVKSIWELKLCIFVVGLKFNAKKEKMKFRGFDLAKKALAPSMDAFGRARA